MSSSDFYEHPILNSPYERPTRHWMMDPETKQPTAQIARKRRVCEHYVPIPKPKKKNKNEGQTALLPFDDAETTSPFKNSQESIINLVRERVELWRALPRSQWGVTHETADLLEHWRDPQSFTGIRPFFCQVEAVETAIWLTEVAPHYKENEAILEHLRAANADADPDLSRIALKLATGAGKTTVMAMLIAWQTINAIRRKSSNRFTHGFLIITPGITIRDRLRVLMPNDPDSYYKSRSLVPETYLPLIARAQIVITNYHAFKLRENISVAAGTKKLIEGWTQETLATTETAGQMMRRVAPELMNIPNIMVINDEAHHCYRERVDAKASDEEEKKNNEAARLWITGLEAFSRKKNVLRVFDLSATPFFLAGSGYDEGTLFPWTVSDFSLMDAIECGIVKLPRVPVDDNVPDGSEMPTNRNLWERIKKQMPKTGRSKSAGKNFDPLSIPMPLQSALHALYEHYKKVYAMWEHADMGVPPCFIIVCNNTTTSKLIYDYVSGFHREDGSFENGKLELFRNFDEYGEPLKGELPRTLLIDSGQLESGEGIDDNFRSIAAAEIERFKRERVERTGEAANADNITDSELLREVMNTVGKKGALGANIRCVVSVSMLTEGWDANTVTHVLGVRAFGTQLLCEQVIGRALRRMNYELSDEGLFEVEYADVFGIPFDFASKPGSVEPKPPVEYTTVKAVSPERDDREIRFPNIASYRTLLPAKEINAVFSEDSKLELTQEMIGATKTQNAGVIGASEVLELNDQDEETRDQTIVYALTRHMLTNHYREPGKGVDLNLFPRMKVIVQRWLDECLVCKGGTSKRQLCYEQLANLACERIKSAITSSSLKTHPVEAIPYSYTPVGSTAFVRFQTSKKKLYETAADRCQVNFAVCDSEWERAFCGILESHPDVICYVRNYGLGFEVPYEYQGRAHKYIPDFIVRIDDGHGEDDPLNVVVEIKGERDEEDKTKAETMRNLWLPGVNRRGNFGRWAFVELGDGYDLESDFDAAIETLCSNAKEA